jgi:type II secretory ATPase GspE/PulE/Tfp pilus assembly ATPase PilB-like protein
VPAPAELDELLEEYCLEGGLDRRKELAGWRERHADREGSFTLFRAPGCGECGRTGYQGRIGLYELLLADATVKQLIQTRASVTEIRDAAVSAGMRTLKQNGIEKVLQGFTDIHQVRAVCG